MTNLPPNVFDSGAIACAPEEAAAAPSPRSPAAAAEIQSSCGGVKEPPVSTSDYNGVQSPALVTAHGLSRKSCPLSRVVPGPQEAIDDIGEIFVGARKLEPVEMWFENAAYSYEDELLYDVLLAMDDPHAPDLIEMPYGMEGIFDPPPLFLQRTG